LDDKTRQQITWIVIIALVASVVVLAAYRRAEVDSLLHTIATGPPSARVAAVTRLIERQKLMEALEDEPRWVQDRAVEAAMMVGSDRALFQLVAAKSVVDEPVAGEIDSYLTSVGDVAIGPLVMALQDKDAAVRGGASAPLKTIAAPAVVSLMPLIDVYDDTVRGLVSSTLGGIGEPAVQPLLRIMTQDEPGPDQGPAAFRRAKSAAEAAFTAMGETAMEPVIGELLEHDDPQVRLAATGILGAVAKPLEEEIGRRAVSPLVGRLTRDDAWAVRRKAASALGGLGETALNNGVVAPLIGSLGDSRSEVRAAAAQALGVLADPVAARPLAQLLLTNRKGAMAEIAEALEKIGQPSVAPLAPALEHPDLDVRLVGAQTLAAIGGPDVVVPLAGALDDAEPKVRRAAADALRNLADPRVLDQLAQALADSEAAVYYAARDALARLGEPAIPALVQALGGADTRVAYMAEQALAQIGGPAIQPLIENLLSADEDAGRWSAIALGTIGEEVVDPVTRLLEDAAAPVSARTAAARALGATGSFSATRPLADAAGSAPPQVQSAAVRALGALGDPASTSTLVAALGAESRDVRDAALEVLKQWRVGDVDQKLQEALGGSDEDATRRAAIVLADHSPTASGELIRAVGAAEEAPAGESRRVRTLLEETVADSGARDDIRSEAIAALTFVGTEASFDALAPLVQAGSSFAEAAAKAVGRIGQRLARETEEAGAEGKAERATELLLSVFDNADSDELRLIAGSGLAVMGGQPVEPLIERLQNGSDEKRAWVAAILGAIGKPATDPLLNARGLLDTGVREKDFSREEQVERREIRRWLGAALTLIGDARALDMLDQLLEEEQPDPRNIEAGREIFVRLQKLL